MQPTDGRITLSHVGWVAFTAVGTLLFVGIVWSGLPPMPPAAYVASVVAGVAYGLAIAYWHVRRGRLEGARGVANGLFVMIAGFVAVRVDWLSDPYLFAVLVGIWTVVLAGVVHDVVFEGRTGSSAQGAG